MTNDSIHEFEWSGRFDGGHAMLAITFSPTRSKIVSVSPTWQARVEVSELRIGLSAPASPEEMIVTVRYTGEPLKDPVSRWIDGVRPTFSIERLNNDERSLYYQNRQTLAKMCAAQRLFFDLDRWTNSSLLPTTLKHDVRMKQGNVDVNAQIAMIKRVEAFLVARVHERLDKTKPSTPPEDLHEAMRSCSRFLRDAIGSMPDGDAGAPDWRTVGEAFCRFAAGDLVNNVCVNEAVPTAWAATEPDSAFVVLFAEFALAAIRLPPHTDTDGDPAVWEALLPYFVKMQEYYFARMPGTPKEFARYGTPGRPMDWKARLEIDKTDFTSLDPAALENRMNHTLKRFILRPGEQPPPPPPPDPAPQIIVSPPSRSSSSNSRNG